jgi:hypothetical protein
VSVTRCSGRSIRPAISQPEAMAATPTTASAMPPWVSSALSASCRVARPTSPTNVWLGPEPASPVMVVSRLPLSCCETSTYVTPSMSTPASRNSPP